MTTNFISSNRDDNSQGSDQYHGQDTVASTEHSHLKNSVVKAAIISVLFTIIVALLIFFFIQKETVTESQTTIKISLVDSKSKAADVVQPHNQSLFSQPVQVQYNYAINALNHGNIKEATMVLKHIVEKYPSHKAAKSVYSQLTNQ